MRRRARLNLALLSGDSKPAVFSTTGAALAGHRIPAFAIGRDQPVMDFSKKAKGSQGEFLDFRQGRVSEPSCRRNTGQPRR